MTEHDILSDAEREALIEVMKAPARAQPTQRVLVVEDDQLACDLRAGDVTDAWHTIGQGGHFRRCPEGTDG